MSSWEAPGQVTFALDAVTAVATAGATIVAVWLARNQIEQREVEKAARIRAETRLYEAQQEAIKSQARRIIFQVLSGQPGEQPRDHTWMGGENDDEQVTCWRVKVRNATSDPVRDVLVWISPEDHPKLADVARFDMVPADETSYTETGARSEIIRARPHYRAQFTDAEGRRWEARHDGELRQI